MNIQQALNQSLLAVGTSVYLSGQTIDRGRETDTAKYKDASDDAREKKAEYDAYVEKTGPVLERRGLSKDEIFKKYEESQFGQAKNEAEDRRARAEKNLRKWYWTSEKPDDLVNLYDTKERDDFRERFQAAFNEAAALNEKRKDAKALASLLNKTNTAANTKEAVQDRIDKLHSGTYKSRMHQPSVRMEE